VSPLLWSRRVPNRRVHGAWLLAAAVACGPGGPAVGGARGFDEIDVPAANRAIAEEDARLVQARDPHDPRAGAAVAVIDLDDPIPAAWVQDARPVVVIARDEVAARRLAARLVREGVRRVSVVRGGIEAWTGSPGDSVAPSDTVGLSGARDATPWPREPARRTDSWQQSQK
jgi:rhodanese-related sulfurtransferase